MEWPCCVRLPHGKLRQGLQYAGGKIYSDICSKYDLKYFRKIYSRVLRQIWFQDSAEKEGQPEILSETVHNLAKSSQTGFYIIILTIKILIIIIIWSSRSSSSHHQVVCGCLTTNPGCSTPTLCFFPHKRWDPLLKMRLWGDSDIYESQILNI